MATNASPSPRKKRLPVALFCILACAGACAAQQASDARMQNPPGAVPAAIPDSTAAASLEECLSASQTGSPSLKTARLSLDTASAQLAYALGSNGLTLGENGGYFYDWNLPGSPAPASALTSAASTGVIGNNIKAGLSLSGPSTNVGLAAQQGIAAGGDQSTALSLAGSQVVYDGYPGGRPAALVKEAQYTARIAQVSYDSALESLAYQVKEAYYTLLGDQNGLVAREATVKQAEEELAQMQGYLKAGRATSLDVLQVQVALTQARLDLRSAQNTMETDRKKLSLTVGWPLDRKYTVLDAAIQESTDLGPRQALETAFKERPELKTLQLEIAYAGVDLSLQNSQYSPSVSVNASLGLAQDWTTNSLGNGALSAGVTIALPPLYDGKQQSSLMRQKGNVIESFKVQLDQERQSITIDVQNALFSVQDARDRLDLAKENLDETQGVYDMQQAKFRAGSASALDVMTAFANLATAQTGLETARSNYYLAILTLNYDMGL